MKICWLIGLALGLAAVKPAVSQVSVYADFSASKLTGGIATQTTSILYGPTFGISAQFATKAHLNLSGDLRASLLGTSQRMDGVALGPKIGFTLHKNYGIYGEFLVGFARYNDGLGNPASASTDSQIQLNAGIDRRITPRLDWRVFEYGYQEYYGLGGEYNPKTFSTGVVLYLQKR